MSQRRSTEALKVLADIVKHADKEAVNAFGDAVKQASKASPEDQGNWANSSFDTRQRGPGHARQSALTARAHAHALAEAVQ